MATSSRTLTDSQRTIASYEKDAGAYDQLVAALPSEGAQTALRRLAAMTVRGGRVLEIGSGPGRDADFIETLGVHVHRTDATQAFLDLQIARGKAGQLLDVLHDDLGGPYDAAMAMCVLIHIERGATDAVLRKIANALHPGSGFLVSVRDGTGETRGDYLMTYWSRDDFASRLEQAGLSIDWEYSHIGREEQRWFTFLAHKRV